VNAALYVSIWLSLALFAAGDAGRARLGAAPSAVAWPWWSWVAGIALAVVHFALAFELRHDWSQEAAVRATAAQTAAVYGLDWGGGFFVNYLFLAVWTIDAWRWRAAPGIVDARGRVVRWMLRAFYLIVILNGAVIFAAGWRRLLGLLIVVALVWPRRAASGPPR
jgi:hypothetical protein